jgi:hypothetical protein
MLLADLLFNPIHHFAESHVREITRVWCSVATNMKEIDQILTILSLCGQQCAMIETESHSQLTLRKLCENRKAYKETPAFPNDNVITVMMDISRAGVHAGQLASGADVRPVDIGICNCE